MSDQNPINEYMKDIAFTHDTDYRKIERELAMLVQVHGSDKSVETINLESLTASLGQMRACMEMTRIALKLAGVVDVEDQISDLGRERPELAEIYLRIRTILDANESGKEIIERVERAERLGVRLLEKAKATELTYQEMIKTLEFYGNETNYVGEIMGTEMVSSVELDKGKKAIRVLAMADYAKMAERINNLDATRFIAKEAERWLEEQEELNNEPERGYDPPRKLDIE